MENTKLGLWSFARTKPTNVAFAIVLQKFGVQALAWPIHQKKFYEKRVVQTKVTTGLVGWCKRKFHANITSTENQNCIHFSFRIENTTKPVVTLVWTTRFS